MLIREFPSPSTFLRLSANCNVIPVCKEILADMETPVSLLQKIVPGDDPLFLFESVQGGEQWGRYSFIGTSSQTELVVFRDVVEIRRGESVERTPHAGDPFRILREFMEQYRPASLQELPRFWGGLVGYLAYEIISFFEPVPNRLPADVALARFMLPDLLYIFDNVSHTLQIVAIAFLDDHDRPQEAYSAARRQIDDALLLVQNDPPAASEHAVPIGALQAMDEADSFRNGVRRVKDDIRNGEIITICRIASNSASTATTTIDLNSFFCCIVSPPLRLYND